MTTHGCPGRCGATTIPRHLLACRDCWRRLPKVYKDPIRHTYRKAAGKPLTDPAWIAHRNAVKAAFIWYADNPIEETTNG